MTSRASGAADCPTHGQSPSALLCAHLASESGRCYFAVPPCEHGPAQAWCEDCDAVVEAERGWTDTSESHADFRVLCPECYARALRMHVFVSYHRGADETCDWADLRPPDVV